MARYPARQNPGREPRPGRNSHPILESIHAFHQPMIGSEIQEPHKVVCSHAKKASKKPLFNYPITAMFPNIMVYNMIADCPHPGPLPLRRAREKFFKGFWLATPLAKTRDGKPRPGRNSHPILESIHAFHQLTIGSRNLKTI